MKTQNAWVHYWSLRKSIISANIIGDLSGPDGSGRCKKAVKWKTTVALVRIIRETADRSEWSAVIHVSSQ